MNKPSQADWRPNPVTERTLIEDLHAERRRRTTLFFLIASGLVLCPVGCLGMCAVSTESAFGVLGMCVAAVVAFLFAAYRYSQELGRQRARFLALQAEYGHSPGWLVEILIVQGEAMTGRDVGLVWFADERLYFTGARTSFALGGGDVDPGFQPGFSLLDRHADLLLSLRSDRTALPVRLGFQFLYEDRAYHDFSQIRADFRRGMTEAFKDGTGHGQWPPLTIGPDVPTLAALQRRAFLATLVWFVIAALIVGLGLTGNPVMIVPIVLLASFFAPWSVLAKPGRCWKAAEDRERLDALERGRR